VFDALWSARIVIHFLLCFVLSLTVPKTGFCHLHAPHLLRRHPLLYVCRENVSEFYHRRPPLERQRRSVDILLRINAFQLLDKNARETILESLKRSKIFSIAEFASGHC